MENPSSGSTLTTYWVDRISLISILRLIKLSFDDRKRHSVYVRYFESNSKLLLIALRSIGFQVDPERIMAELGDLRAEDGSNLRYQVGEYIEEASLRVVSKLELDQILSSAFSQPFDENKIKRYFLTAVEDEIQMRLRQFSIIEALIKEQPRFANREQVFVFEQTPNEKILNMSTLSKSNVKFESYLRDWPIPAFFREISLLFFQLVWATIVSIVRAPYDFGANKNAPQKPNTIAMRFSAGVDLSLRNDLFWFPKSNIKPEHLLIYFQGKRKPSEKVRIDIRSKNFQLVNLKRWKIIGYSWHSVRLLARPLFNVANTIQISFDQTVNTWWLLTQILKLERQVATWTSFFTSKNIRIHIHNSGGIASIPTALAIETVGGVDVGYQWSASDFFYRDKPKIIANHILFSWGPFFNEEMVSLGLSPNYVFNTGELMHSRDDESEETLIKTRSKLRSAGAKKIVGVFDSSFSAYIHFSCGAMRSFYRAIWDWGKRNPSVGIIIKPKDSDIFKKEGFREILENLEALDNCVVLDYRIKPSSVANIADFTMGFGINSAVINAAIAGRNGAHINASAENRNPMYTLGENKIAFNDIKPVLSQIETIPARILKTGAFGNHEPFLDEIDPYRDGMGGDRMGMAISWLMDALDRGENRTQAMETSVRKYQKKFGRKMANVQRTDIGSK